MRGAETETTALPPGRMRETAGGAGPHLGTTVTPGDGTTEGREIGEGSAMTGGPHPGMDGGIGPPHGRIGTSGRDNKWFGKSEKFLISDVDTFHRLMLLCIT